MRYNKKFNNFLKGENLVFCGSGGRISINIKSQPYMIPDLIFQRLHIDMTGGNTNLSSNFNINFLNNQRKWYF